MLPWYLPVFAILDTEPRNTKHLALNPKLQEFGFGICIEFRY